MNIKNSTEFFSDMDDNDWGYMFFGVALTAVACGIIKCLKCLCCS